MSGNNEGNRVNPGHFGRGVIGDKAFDAEQKTVEDLGDIFGPGVIGKPEPTVNVVGTGVLEQAPAGHQVGPMLSLRALKDALDASPLLVDTFLPVELARAEGPRKGALVVLADAERRRPGGYRDAVMAQLDPEFGASAGAEDEMEAEEEPFPELPPPDDDGA